MTTVTDATVIDLRFPTSRNLDGSDAMNPDPDYSAAYLRLSTSEAELAGHGFVFTIGRGNDIQAAAVGAVAERHGRASSTRGWSGADLDALVEDPGAVNRELTWDSQLRWLGPDKGVMHMAIGAVMNALSSPSGEETTSRPGRWRGGRAAGRARPRCARRGSRRGQPGTHLGQPVAGSPTRA